MQRLLHPLRRVLAAELYVVASLVVLCVWSENFLNLAVRVCLAFWAARAGAWWLEGRRSANASLLRVFSGFATFLGGMLLVSLAITAFPQVTWPQTLRTGVGMTLCFAVIHWVGLECGEQAMTRVHAFATASMCVCLGLALAGPFIVDWQDSNKFPIIPAGVYTSFTRLVGDGVNPNVMAGTLVILVPIPLSSLLFSRRLQQAKTRKSRWHWLRVIGLPALTLGVALPMLVLTQSRGAFIALAASISALFVLRSRKLLVPILAAVIAVALFWAAQPSAFTTFITTLASASSISGLDSRIEIWSRAWYMVQDFAFTGIGMGGFKQVTDLLYPLILTQEVIPHAHNLFLQVAVDLGIPGFVAWMGMLICVFIASWRAYRSHVPILRAVGAGLLASQIALCIHGLTDAVTWGMVRTAPLVWAIWGTAMAAGLTAHECQHRSIQQNSSKQKEHLQQALTAESFKTD